MRGVDFELAHAEAFGHEIGVPPRLGPVLPAADEAAWQAGGPEAGQRHRRRRCLSASLGTQPLECPLYGVVVAVVEELLPSGLRPAPPHPSILLQPQSPHPAPPPQVPPRPSP